jgi:PilZ domain
MMEERRTSPRHRVLKAGTIEFGEEALPCTVRSLSATGARIEVNSPLWFPDRFTLAIASEGWRKPCRVIWRDERRIGVEFEQP